MARRPTIADLAARSGVSVATIDRVLNGRLPVREETARRVYEAASALGFHAAGLIRQRIEKGLPHFRIGFLLQKREHFFYQAFGEALTRAARESQGFRCTPQLDFLPDQIPNTVCRMLREIGARNQAIAVTTIDHPQISAAVAELQERGVPVVSLHDDFAWFGRSFGVFGFSAPRPVIVFLVVAVIRHVALSNTR
jgi:LacI family transcriptional regulator